MILWFKSNKQSNTIQEKAHCQYLELIRFWVFNVTE